MPDYKKMYFHLFNGITDAIEYIQSFKNETNAFAVASLVNKLKQLQVDGEDMYIDAFDEPSEYDKPKSEHKTDEDI